MDGEEPPKAEELAALLKRHRLASSLVNLIPWNPVGGDTGYRRPSPKAVAAFRAACERGGLSTSVRATRGLGADAACGMLAHPHQKVPLANPQPLL